MNKLVEFFSSLGSSAKADIDSIKSEVKIVENGLIEKKNELLNDLNISKMVEDNNDTIQASSSDNLTSTTKNADLTQKSEPDNKTATSKLEDLLVDVKSHACSLASNVLEDLVGIANKLDKDAFSSIQASLYPTDLDKSTGIIGDIANEVKDAVTIASNIKTVMEFIKKYI